MVARKTAGMKMTTRKRAPASKRIIAELQDRGFKSPYLRTYVVARINPVRFHRAKKKDAKPPMAMGAGLTRMAASARKLDTSSLRHSDLALVAAVASDE